jgi:general nucleoside transport system permease protein
MAYPDPAILFASVVSGATPVVIASMGETIAEKSGVINLSLDGTILLSAMTGFVTAYSTGSLLMGFLAAGATGGLIASILAVFSIYLKQSQVAVGFVLTLLARDIAYFFGSPYSRLPGPQVAPFHFPLLKDIFFFGDVFFQHNLLVYVSLTSLPFFCWYIYYTGPGLKLRAIGENPNASYARGVNPRPLRFFYVVSAGIMAGIAGASFSLFTKPGWGHPQGAEGTGWIVLAIVIFGGWNPLKVAVGAFLFSFLQVMGIYFQEWFPYVPAQVFQVAPFPLMIFTLLVVNLTKKESVLVLMEGKPIIQKVLKALSGNPPEALGKVYEPESSN